MAGLIVSSLQQRQLLRKPLLLCSQFRWSMLLVHRRPCGPCGNGYAWFLEMAVLAKRFGLKCRGRLAFASQPRSNYSGQELREMVAEAADCTGEVLRRFLQTGTRDTAAQESEKFIRLHLCWSVQLSGAVL